MCIVNTVERIDHDRDKVVHLLLICMIEFFKVLHSGDITGLRTDLLPILVSIREYHL